MITTKEFRKNLSKYLHLLEKGEMITLNRSHLTKKKPPLYLCPLEKTDDGYYMVRANGKDIGIKFTHEQYTTTPASTEASSKAPLVNKKEKVDPSTYYEQYTP